jgi:flagellar hook-associated protein 3 FlgL
MRVATRSLYQGIQQRLLKLTSDLKTANEKISSGKRILRPSDDPIGLTDSLGFKSALSQAAQYARSGERGTSWLNQSESAISGALELVIRAKEIAIEMASDTQDAGTRAQGAVEVGHLLDEAIALGNTRLEGSYVFAGYRTKTTPFLKATVGGIETAQYQGDTHDFQIQIGRDERLAVGRNGQTVFMDSSLFDTLGNLKNALENNDLSGIQQQVGGLNGVSDYLNNQIADVGARANRLEIKQESLSLLTADLEERLSQVQDTDLVEMTIELKEKELAYQAALSAAARLTEINILSYLG